VPVITA